MYGVHHKDNLTADSVLTSPRNAKFSPRDAKSFIPSQNQFIKQRLHTQMVQLRGAFLHEDPRITGTIPRFLLASTLKAGGLDLSPAQAKEAANKFITGDGRFNWMTCVLTTLPMPASNVLPHTSYMTRMRLVLITDFATVLKMRGSGPGAKRRG